LIDAIGGGHPWAERFDRNLDGIFAVQDEAVSKIVDALVGPAGTVASAPAAGEYGGL
jgi:TolB-like protein